MRTLTTLLLITALAACTALPAPHLAPEGSETAATVEPRGPGQYHILVRINYFAPDGEAERLLRARAATLCAKDEAVHLDHLATVRQPAMAAADLTCGDRPAEPPADAAAAPPAAGAAAPDELPDDAE